MPLNGKLTAKCQLACVNVAKTVDLLTSHQLAGAFSLSIKSCNHWKTHNLCGRHKREGKGNLIKVASVNHKTRNFSNDPKENK